MSSSDFNKPVITDTYTSVLPEIVATFKDLALGLDPATTSPANTPSGAVRWNSANAYWEKLTGSSWGALASTYNIDVSGSASKWASARTLSLTGDGSASLNVDGSANVSATFTLKNTGTAGTYGDATHVPVVTTDAQGRVTAVSLTSISFPSVPVTSVFGRTGAVTLTSGDVAGALGYTPYNAASISGASVAYATGAANSGHSLTSDFSSGNVSLDAGFTGIGSFAVVLTSAVTGLGQTFTSGTFSGSDNVQITGTWRALGLLQGGNPQMFLAQRIA